MRKALTLALLSPLLILWCVPAPSQAATRPTRTERKVIRLVNRERAARGLAPVRFNARLTYAARAHSRQQARRGVLTHLSANGDGVGRRAIRHGYTRSGYRYWTVGEDIARARSGSLFATPTGIVSLWMGSRAHRLVILKKNLRNVGVGVAGSADGSRYFTLDMGRRIR
jgi:uncharacterized protein YkwD